MQITFQYFEDDHSRYSRQPGDRPGPRDEPHHHRPHHSTAPSEAVPVFLPFPGTEPNIKTGEAFSSTKFLVGIYISNYIYRTEF